MVDASQHMARPLLNRYEVKYVVNESLVPYIRTYMKPYMRPDPFCDGSGTSYPVSSLYLDSDDLALFRETVDGIKRRFKLRIRAYDDADSPLYCEVKYRNSDVISKTRAAIPREALQAVLRGSYALATSEPEKKRSAVAEFQSQLVARAAKPRLVVCYDREAYESANGAKVRITFDRNLRYFANGDRGVPVGGVPWRPTRTGFGPSALVFEVKFSDVYPGWVHDMVRHFEIRQRGFGKYVLSTSTHLDARVVEGRSMGMRMGP